VQDTGAPTPHDKPGSLTCPTQSTDTRMQFALRKQSQQEKTAASVLFKLFISGYE